jgi:capsular exopolysaccharide synthesis family protein
MALSVPVAGAGRLIVGSSTPPPTGLTVFGLLACVRRRWKQAILLGLVVASTAAFLVWMFLPPAKPYAFTKLYFQTRPAGSVDHPDPPVNQQTQKELITSRIVLRTALEDPEVAQLSCITEKPDPISWLIRELEIDFPTGSEIMRITLREDRADEARVIIDKIAQAYMAKIGNEAMENRKQTRRKLEEKLEAAKKEHHEDVARSGTTSSGGTATPEVIAQNQRMINNEINQANNELMRIRDQLIPLRRDEEALVKRLAKTPVEMSAAEFEPVFAQNPGANRLKQIRDELQAEYDVKLAGLGPENPTMVALKNRIDAAESRLEALRGELKTTIAFAFQEKLTEDLRKKREEISKLVADEKAKLNDIQQKEAERKRWQDTSAVAGRVQPQLTASSELVRELTAKLSKLETEMDAPLAVKQIDPEAVVVRPHDATRRMKMSSLAAIVLFCLAFASVGFLEFRANRVASAGEVTQTLGLRLMGTVPARPKHATIGMTDSDWEKAVNEAVDSTRTVFLHSAGIQNLRTVMVTSAVGGEGKTSLSVGLAASLARSGRRTLLIDADLRNPGVHSQFNLAVGPGVAEILRGEVSAASAVRPTRRDNLWVLPAGTCDARAIGALAQDEFSRLLAEVGQSGFDFVLIDSCPVLPVADALLVARHVDGVLLSLMVDYSQVDRVNAACQKLASVDVPLLGAVVNGTRGESYGYGYGYAPDYRAAVTG